MRSAARGALSLPPADMLDILVHLATDPEWEEDARQTLANWDEHSAQEVLRSPSAPLPVLRYFTDPAHLRPALLPSLLANPAVPLAAIARLAESANTEVVKAIANCKRVQESPEVFRALASNPQITAELQARAEAQLAKLPAESDYEREHAAEIAATEGTPFSLVDAGDDERSEVSKAEDGQRETVLQKIAALKVGERIKLAMLGTREERFILIRDANKVVSVAVLQSPKLSETEMETYAAMKNVQEDVLRSIARNRRFMKQYSVVRALANNPRAPVDIGLPLVAHLTANDLQHLMRNKNVAEPIRKLAAKIFRTKTSGRD